MRPLFTALALFASLCMAQEARVAGSLAEVRRIYVGPLTGGTGSQPLRDVIIASLNSTGLFILTDDVNRADAILKGAAEDKAYTDTFDSDQSVTAHNNGGLYGASRSSSSSGRGSGGYGGLSGGDREAYHIRERKHEAYAAVRLVNRAGDTLWSTTQESGGAKFRGASTDIGAKIARQITLDMERAQRLSPGSVAGPKP